MIDFVHFEYEPVDSDFALNWFRDHELEREMVIRYFSAGEQALSEVSIEEVVENLDFVYSEEVGVFPSHIGDGELYVHEQIWSNSSLTGGRRWDLYKVLWFLVAEWFSEEEKTIEVFPLSLESEILSQMQVSSAQDHKEMEEFLYGPEGDFIVLDDAQMDRFSNMTVLKERIEESSFYGNATKDHVLRIVKDDSGSLFVVVEHYGVMEKYLPIQSEEEGLSVMSRFW